MVIGIAAQELPCPAARIELRQIPIVGWKPRYIEPPHLIVVERERVPVFENLSLFSDSQRKLKIAAQLSADNQRYWGLTKNG